jgi:hypothetical protein
MDDEAVLVKVLACLQAKTGEHYCGSQIPKCQVKASHAALSPALPDVILTP